MSDKRCTAKTRSGGRCKRTAAEDGLCTHHRLARDRTPEKRPKPERQEVVRRRARQRAFLAAYRKMATVTHAADAVGIDRRRHYDWLETDPDYAEEFVRAQEEAVDELEREARRRAIEGVREPAGWYKGKPGGYVRKYSDTLLIFLLKGARPDKYRERYEHSGPGGGPVESKVTFYLPRKDGDDGSDG